MATQSGTTTDYWRNYFATADSNIWEVINQAIMVAASDHPSEFRLRRDRIAELLFSCKMTRCSGCERIELAVPAGDDEDKRDMNANRVSSYSFGDAEALTNEIEEEGQIFDEVLRIKDILDNSEYESDSVLLESLRKLQLMLITVQTLEATDIGKSVSKLRKHGSGEIRYLSKTLIKCWKDMVNDYVNSTTAITTGANEDTPDSVYPSGLDDEEGLPFPPLEEEAFYMTQPSSMELTGFFDGMDDDGNPCNYEGSGQTRRNERKSAGESRDTVNLKQRPHNEQVTKIQQVRKQEAEVKQKTNKSANTVSIQRRTLATQHDKLKGADEARLAGAVRKLQQNYQQAEHAKKQRTIQVVNLHDLPKPKQQYGGQRNSQTKPGSRNRHSASTRRR